MGSKPGAYSEIEYAVSEGIATLTLNRPSRLNAYTPTMMANLVDALDQTDNDDTVRVVVVTGRGRAFCAGAELDAGANAVFAPKAESSADGGPVIGGAPRDTGGILALRIARSLKPVIAAINGPAVGIGATMTLPMDIRIASDAARFGFVFVRRGIVPEAASSWFLPRIVGISQALEWVATGRIFPATEALERGLVTRVVPQAQLLDMAYAMAGEIARTTSAVAVALSRQLLWRMLGAQSPWDAHRMDSQLLHFLAQAPDAAEGVTSFLEKRQPIFTMKVSSDLPDIAPRWPADPAESS